MPRDPVAELVIEDLAAELHRAEVSRDALLTALVDLAERDVHLEQMARTAWMKAAYSDAQVDRLRRQLRAFQQTPA